MRCPSVSRHSENHRNRYQFVRINETICCDDVVSEETLRKLAMVPVTFVKRQMEGYSVTYEKKIVFVRRWFADGNEKDISASREKERKSDGPHKREFFTSTTCTGSSYLPRFDEKSHFNDVHRMATFAMRQDQCDLIRCLHAKVNWIIDNCQRRKQSSVR